MNLQFKTVTLHNFLSYQHTELNLTDKGYCLVSGINYDKRDESASNGSGKSTWSSAICWALTGETIQGVSSKLKNKEIAEKECWVNLKFKADNDEYDITRYVEPKSDLKIKLNGKDISGKGIRESEAILNSHLPDISPQLIASVIILGQGLPNKFSANKPSGRKEVLEELSRTDFMIDDLKVRVQKRSEALNNQMRAADDALLIASTQKNTVETNINNLQSKLDLLNAAPDYQKEIEALNNQIAKESQKQQEIDIKINNKNAEYATLLENIKSINNQKAAELAEDAAEFNEYYRGYLKKESEHTNQINTLTTAINKIKNIKDVCPTCGRPLEGVVKPSTENEEKELKTLQESLQKLKQAHKNNNEEHDKYVAVINSKYRMSLADASKEEASIKQELALLHKSKDAVFLNSMISRKAKLEADQQNHAKNIADAEASLISAKNTLKNLNDTILYNNNEKDKINAHISAVNKMATLIKRDFRGFLLSNVITFIDNKAKEYASTLFGTTSLNFALDGNNINIEYCDKPFENLSGGEKQKVDLIIQFAIRDMMSQYLNFSSNILVLDEIFDNLDSTCCASVINLISNKINDVESIFIISHHSAELHIPADSEMTVVKDSNGISKVM